MGVTVPVVFAVNAGRFVGGGLFGAVVAARRDQRTDIVVVQRERDAVAFRTISYRGNFAMNGPKVRRPAHGCHVARFAHQPRTGLRGTAHASQIRHVLRANFTTFAPVRVTVGAGHT